MYEKATGFEETTCKHILTIDLALLPARQNIIATTNYIVIAIVEWYYNNRP